MTLVRQTQRLDVRHLEPDDAPFMLELLNDPDWLRYIGDRGVRTTSEARTYLENGAIRSYREHGFGLYCVVRRDTGASTGICGLVRRPGLDDVDLGFAFLPAYRSLGYATEAGRVTMHHAWTDCALTRVVAITSADNGGSIRVLEKLGFIFEKFVGLTPGADEVRLFGIAAPLREASPP